MSRTRRPPGMVSARSVLLGALLIPPTSYFSIQTPTPTTVSVVYTSIMVVFALVLLNGVFKRLVPRAAFSQGELLTVYAMLNLSTVIAGHDILQVLAPILGHAFWFATPENEWQPLFFRHIPAWLTVSDLSVLRGHYEEGYTLYASRVLRAWAGPVAWWSLFLVALMLAMLCLNALLARQWTAVEKLSYPIIQLPLRLTTDGGSRAFLGNRMMWAGFAIAGAIDLVNGLHDFYPMIPLLPTRTVELSPLLKEKPWSAIGWTPVCFFPFAIGLSFFMPLSLSFSTWVFYWVWKAQLVVGDVLGLRQLPEFPYVKPQASGAWLAVGAFAVWNARRHLSAVARHLTGRNRLDDASEPMPYRLAAVGFVVASVFLLGFWVRAGMSLWVATIFFAAFFGLSLAVVRLRAELGAPVNELYNVGPDTILVNTFGARALGPRNLTAVTLGWGITRAQRCHPMPHQLEGFKMAEQVGMNARRLALAMAIATVLGTLAGFWAYLDVRYRQDFDGGFGWEAWNRLADWLTFSPSPNAAAIVAMFVGFGAVSGLSLLRYRFVWWPLHPVAYPLASSINWSASWFWSSIFVSWLAKSAILRHGGLPAYRSSIPFFMGLILGDFLVGGAFNIYGVLTHIHTYTFWH